MNPPLNQSTKSFWSVIGTRKHDYAFWAVTHISPAPPLVPQRVFGCTYVPCAYDGNTYWGFKEHDKRNEFCRRYSANPWSPA